MSRNVVSVVVAFALLVGGSMIVGGSSAEAGHCGGGLFAKLKAARSCCAPAPAPVVECCPPVEKSCGGGLFAKLRAKLAAHKASCCAPEPVCCEPAPAPCCEPAPAPCCEPAPAPCCGSAPAPAPCCGGSGEVVYGETIISEAPVESASDEVPPAPAAPEAAKE